MNPAVEKGEVVRYGEYAGDIVIIYRVARSTSAEWALNQLKRKYGFKAERYSVSGRVVNDGCLAFNIPAIGKSKYGTRALSIAASPIRTGESLETVRVRNSKLLNRVKQTSGFIVLGSEEIQEEPSEEVGILKEGVVLGTFPVILF